MEGNPGLIELMTEMLDEQRQTNVRLESMDNRMESTNKRLDPLKSNRPTQTWRLGNYGSP